MTSASSRHLRGLAALRSTVATLLLYEIVRWGAHAWYFDTLPPGLWDPISASQFLPAMPSTGSFSLLWLCSVASLVAVAVGLATRVTAPVACASMAVLGAATFSFGKVNHAAIPPLLCLLMLCFTPMGAAWSVDAWRARRRGQALGGPARSWHLTAIAAVFAILYPASAYSKLRRGNFLQSGALDTTLGRIRTAKELDGETFSGFATATLDWVHAHPGVTDAVAWMVVAAEAAVIIVLAGPRGRLFAMGIIMMLHASIWEFMRIAFPAAGILALAFAAVTVNDMRRPQAEPTASVDATPYPRRTALLLAATALASMGLLAEPAGSWDATPTARAIQQAVVPSDFTALFAVVAVAGLCSLGAAIYMTARQVIPALGNLRKSE